MVLKKENPEKESPEVKPNVIGTSKLEDMKRMPTAGVFVYIGPTLPNGSLKSNSILGGTFDEICAFLKGQIEEYPQIKRLIVPVHKLAEYKARTKNRGDIYNRYYADIASVSAKKKEE